mmetsp:Transcript_16869/g.25775  ORF Transcript_16869/g.25775 Transcript_16869/m.25775 type:complete len:478 (+) Transcript_16869:61-1494(+)
MSSFNTTNDDFDLKPKRYRTLDEFYNEAHQSLEADRIGYLIIFIALGLANVGDASESGSVNFLLADEDFQKELLGDNDGFLASSLYIGMLVGGIFTGPISDVRRGRRTVLMMGLLITSCFGIISALSGTFWQLCICRAVVGVGVGTVGSSLLALTTEHTPSAQRGRYIALVSASWTIGAVYVAVVAFWLFGTLNTSWRIYLLVNAIPSFLALVMVWLFVPESARHLALQGHYREATAVANYLGESMGHTERAMQLEEINAQFNVKREDKTLRQVVMSIRNLYRKNIRGRTLIIQFTWFTLTYASGINVWLARLYSDMEMPHVYTLGLVYALGSLPANVVAYYLIDRFSRVRLLVASGFLMTLSLAVFSTISEYSQNPLMFMTVGCVLNLTYVLSWTVLAVVTAESFPTSVRSTAVGVSAATGRLAAIAMNLVTGTLLNQATAPTIIFGISGMASFLGVLMLVIVPIPNMTGEPLEDI